MDMLLCFSPKERSPTAFRAEFCVCVCQTLLNWS